MASQLHPTIQPHTQQPDDTSPLSPQDYPSPDLPSQNSLHNTENISLGQPQQKLNFLRVNTTKSKTMCILMLLLTVIGIGLEAGMRLTQEQLHQRRFEKNSELLKLTVIENTDAILSSKTSTNQKTSQPATADLLTIQQNSILKPAIEKASIIQNYQKTTKQQAQHPNQEQTIVLIPPKLTSSREVANNHKSQLPIPQPFPRKTNDEGLTQKVEKHAVKFDITRMPTMGAGGISFSLRDQAVEWRLLTDKRLYEPTDVPANLSESEYLYYDQKYQISNYPELPFCLVIPTFENCENDRHIRNIASILIQNYTNYHMVILDDQSKDGTGDKIENYLKSNEVPPSRYIVVKNKEKLYAMGSLRKAAKEYCKSDDVFMVVDGDDELLGRQVLKLFNAAFQRDGAWFVYSNFLVSNGEIGYSRPLPADIKQRNHYRGFPFITSHLRAFYTQLFLNIKESDLQDDQGRYLRAANDVAICIPILEMSHRRVTYLPQLTYFYNAATGSNNHNLRLIEQKRNDRYIRTKPKYAELSQLLFSQ